MVKAYFLERTYKYLEESKMDLKEDLKGQRQGLTTGHLEHCPQETSEDFCKTLHNLILRSQ